MDNASKALIMAGAILLAVAIVGLGVYLFSLSQGLIDTAESSLGGLSTELQNNELLKYEGTIKGTQVRKLIDRALYLKNNDWPISLTIKLNGSEITSRPATSSIQSSKNYPVSMTVDTSSGYVSGINIGTAPKT